MCERVAQRRFRRPGGEDLLDLPRAPLPDPETPAPVRFLPTWDATLLVHARRALILPEEHRTKVFSLPNPHYTPTFLVDGAVAGTWRHEGGRGRALPIRAARRRHPARAEGGGRPAGRVPRLSGAVRYQLPLRQPPVELPASVHERVITPEASGLMEKVLLVLAAVAVTV